MYERLAAFQLTAFAAMEILERLGSGVGLRHLAPTLRWVSRSSSRSRRSWRCSVRFVARTAAAVADRVADAAPVWSSEAVTLIAGPSTVVALAPAGGPPHGRAPPIPFVR